MMQFVKSFRFKILIFYTAVLLMLALFLLFNNAYSVDAIQQESLSSSLAIQRLYVGRLDASLDDLRNYLVSVTYQNPELFIIQDEASPENDLFLSIQRIQRRLDKDRAVYGIADMLFHYMSQSDTLILSAASQPLLEGAPLLLRDALQRMKTSNERNEDRWYMTQIGDTDGLIRVVSDGMGNQTGAWISVKRLFGITRETHDASIISTHVLALDGRQMLSSVPHDDMKEMLDRYAAQWTELPKPIRNNQTGKGYLVYGLKLAKADLLYITVIPEDMALTGLPYLRAMGILVPIVITFSLLLFLLYLRSTLFKPVDAIIHGMKQAAEGNLSVRLSDSGMTEWNILIHGFNDMVERIKHLQVDVLDERLKNAEARNERQKAEMKYLQLQINPHFLANSLSIVYSLTLVHDMETIRKLSLHMAQYFRYAMRTKDEMVPLLREFQFIQEYLAIQKIRFTRRLEYHISLPDPVAQALLPPMTLQPFVENCIVHSMVELEEPLVVHVMAAFDDEHDTRLIHIDIYDNGRGFPTELLETLNDPEFLNTPPDRHTGIWNVAYRLRIHFNGMASLCFSNPPNGGAHVRLIVPYESSNPLEGT